jgi:RsiW-degrading membrane proteinase PrsW (M82 family)
MVKIIGFIILASLLTALFVYYHYAMFKAIERKSKIAILPLYFRIGVRLIILMGGLYFLWTAQFSDLGSVLPLAYILISLVISLAVLLKIWSSRKESEKQLTNDRTKQNG